MSSVALYLKGVYCQGTGDLDNALRIFQDPTFEIVTSPSALSSAKQVEHDFALLAALNCLWILQEPQRRDIPNNIETISKLKDLCNNNPNQDIQVAFHLAAATVRTGMPQKTIDIKSHLSVALKYAQLRSNAQFICISLAIMCSSFFTNVIGDQAEKSAMAASVQAQKAGNELWKSVADGMLANCYQINGKRAEAAATLRKAQRHAQNSMPPGS